MNETTKTDARNFSRIWRAKWNRITGMHPQEIGYRLYKELSFSLDKWKIKFGGIKISDKDLFESFNLDWFFASPDLSRLHFRRYIKEKVGPRFYVNPADHRKYVYLVEQMFPEWIISARNNADKVINHRFPLLGFGDISVGENIDWHMSPETGKRWPNLHWREIDFHAVNAPGDPKLVWELNRHQQLLHLGLAYCYTRDETYTYEFIDQIESWIEQNPYQMGINWSSSLEIAFRSINWFWALFFFINSPCLKTDTLIKIVKTLVLHLEAIYNNPSIYSSPNTHLLGEACALFIGGTLLAEHKSAPRWRNFGAQCLADELRIQLYKDGCYKEQSAYYHSYMVEFYLMALILARKNFNKELFDEAQLTRACEFLMHICQPGGELPAFGDEDGGKALMIGSRTYRRPYDLLATAALLFNRGDFKHCAPNLPEATYWLNGLDSIEKYAAIKTRSPKQQSISFQDSGHTIFRSDWTDNANYLNFHCIGQTHLSGHIHADLLSFEMAFGNRARMIDSGTFNYNGNRSVRNFFRGTSAHNTVRIDGLDQSIPSEQFKWERVANGKVLNHILSPAADYVCGEHDGYQRLANPCLHRRAILFAKPEYFIIWDEFLGEGEHTFESYFHCGDASVDQAENGSLLIKYADDAHLLMVPISDAKIDPEIIKVDDDHPQGWHSPAYGKKEAGLSLKMNWQSNAPISMLTLLFPINDVVPQVESISLAAQHAFCLRISHGEYEDYIIFALNQCEVKEAFGKINFVGERLFMRTNRTSCTRAFALNAQQIEFNNQIVLSDSMILPQFTWVWNS